MPSSCEEEREEEMGSVMKRLFDEEEASPRNQQQCPQVTGSIPPDLPVIPYYNPIFLFIKLAKEIQVHNVHERYKASINIVNNKGISGISNLGLQGSQQPGTRGFVLLAHTQVNMAVPFTRYP